MARHTGPLRGHYQRTVDQLPSHKAKFASKPHISGKDGGHTINLHQFARDRVQLLGRIQGVTAGKIVLAQDLKENQAKADQFEADFVRNIDEYIAKSNRFPRGKAAGTAGRLRRGRRA